MPSGRFCRILALAALFVALGLSPAPARATTNGFSVLHDFAGTGGHSPNGALVWARAGTCTGRCRATSTESITGPSSG